MKAYLLIIILIFCLIFVLPEDTCASVRVTVYFAGGIVIGGVSIFFSIILGGDKQSSESEKKLEDKEGSYAALQAFNYQQKNITEEDVKQAGMVKILEW